MFERTALTPSGSTSPCVPLSYVTVGAAGFLTAHSNVRTCNNSVTLCKHTFILTVCQAIIRQLECLILHWVI